MSAVVKGGFFAQYDSTYTPVNNRNPLLRRVAQLMSKNGMMKLRELMETLNGAAAGSAASKTLKRIEANEEMGGVRVIETETIVGRNTAAGDITEINDHVLALSSKTYDPTPVVNGDGNPLGTR